MLTSAQLIWPSAVRDMAMESTSSLKIHSFFLLFDVSFLFANLLLLSLALALNQNLCCHIRTTFLIHGLVFQRLMFAPHYRLQSGAAACANASRFHGSFCLCLCFTNSNICTSPTVHLLYQFLTHAIPSLAHFFHLLVKFNMPGKKWSWRHVAFFYLFM